MKLNKNGKKLLEITSYIPVVHKPAKDTKRIKCFCGQTIFENCPFGKKLVKVCKECDKVISKESKK